MSWGGQYIDGISIHTQNLYNTEREQTRWTNFLNKWILKRIFMVNYDSYLMHSQNGQQKFHGVVHFDN